MTGPDGVRPQSSSTSASSLRAQNQWLPFVPEDPRIIDSTGALELGGIPSGCW